MPPEVNREPEKRIPTGMAVYDRDSDSFTQMVVVKHTGEPSDEFEVPYTGKTVADYNEDYNPGAPAVKAVYRHALDEKVDDWATLPLDQLHEQVDENSVKTYTYPARRLKSYTSHIPSHVETHRELICYHNARLVELSATINSPEQFQNPLMWSNFENRVDGDVTMSSILKENQYQLKENLGVCTYCNQEAETTFDHIVPVAADGLNEIKNMVPACQSCNSSKSDRNILEWHQEHEIPIDRVVLGKYLKLQWDEFEENGELDNPIPDSLRERWEGLEISRRITQQIWMNSGR